VITLAERTTRYCMIIALPEGRTAHKVAAALSVHLPALPAQLRNHSRGTRARK
jgi:IS30 family transposase